MIGRTRKCTRCRRVARWPSDCWPMVTFGLTEGCLRWPGQTLLRRSASAKPPQRTPTGTFAIGKTLLFLCPQALRPAREAVPPLIRTTRPGQGRADHAQAVRAGNADRRRNGAVRSHRPSTRQHVLWRNREARVLVVEDHAPVAEMIADELRSAGHLVDLVANGRGRARLPECLPSRCHRRGSHDATRARVRLHRATPAANRRRHRSDGSRVSHWRRQAVDGGNGRPPLLAQAVRSRRTGTHRKGRPLANTHSGRHAADSLVESVVRESWNFGCV